MSIAAFYPPIGFSVEIFCTLQIEGIHHWPDCNIEEVSYLSNPHRHMFHIKAHKLVGHDNRDIEFIKLKHDIEAFMYASYMDETLQLANFEDKSCEMLARELCLEFGLNRCEVSEDGENGAIVYV